MNKLNSEERQWPVNKLKPHPQQALHFNNLSRAQLDDLRNDIDANGLREPLEITPDGTVISGHQRLRAIRELQWREVDVVVRHDLARQGDAAIERRLIECNLNRRHLSKLELARSYKRLRELHRGGNRRNGGGDLRDEIGKRLGISGRQLDRLLPLLLLPREVQQAVENRKIPVKRAAELAKLPKAAQDKVAHAIRNGRDLRRALSEQLFDGSLSRQAATSEQLKAQLRSVILQVKRLAENENRLRPLVRADQVPLLRGLADFVLGLCPPVEDANEDRNQKAQSKRKPALKPR